MYFNLRYTVHPPSELVFVVVVVLGRPGPTGHSKDTDSPQVRTWTFFDSSDCWMMLNDEWCLQSPSFQSVEESSDKQEALQVICHQQTAAGSRARLPEGQAQGEFKRVQPFTLMEEGGHSFYALKWKDGTVEDWIWTMKLWS